MNRNNSSFRKAIQDTFRQVKQEEQISPDEINASWKAVEEILSATPKTAGRNRLRRRLLIAGSIAASFLLVISFSVWQMDSAPETPVQLSHMIVSEGRNKQLTLADGTKVHVKANSHIIYPNVFEADRREITLVRGEIYLDVTRNPKAPFTVKADGFDVRVLGTQFNVSVPEKGKPATVVLVEGCVEIENARKYKALLQPNQLADISPENISIQLVDDVMKYVCWKDQIMLLEGDKLAAILEQLSSFYGVDIHCDEEIKNFTLSGKLDLNDSVERTVRVLRLSTGFKYKKDKDGFYIYK